MSKITLTKKFSREHSLFYLENWSYAEIFHVTKVLGDHMNNLIYLCEPGSPQVSSWYDYNEIARLFSLVVKKSENPEFFIWIETEFNRLWDLIWPYIEKKNRIGSLAELKEFRKNVIEFYGPYTAAYVAPDIPQLPQEYKEKSLELRKKVQEIVNDIDEVYLDFFLREFSQYKDIANYITAEEIFSLAEKPFSKDELEKIHKRKDGGYFLLNNLLYPYSELPTVLKKNNLELLDYVLKKRVFTKEHSREYSLFRTYIIHKIMDEYLDKIVGGGSYEAFSINRGGDLTSVYYEKTSLQRIFNQVAKSSVDEEYMKKEVCRFLERFERLKPYFDKEKKPKDMTEFRALVNLYLELWADIGIMYTIPTLPNISDELKKEAYQARAKTQEYNEAFEPVIKEFLEEKYPNLKGKTRYVLPEEVWNKEVEKPEILEKIKQRQNGFIYHKAKLYVGDLDKYLDEQHIELADLALLSGQPNSDLENSNEIKGQVAWKGKVQGRVKIVSSVKDLDKVNQGDILVTAMTMPKYIVAMKKASAFVTDEGGITSHAAIIAREMNKPCIIGTKIATQVLKDNMLVEVDADNGTVRILK